MIGKLRWTGIVGFIIHLLIGGMMIMAGGFKLFGKMPPEVVEKMATTGIGSNLTLIGVGEIIAAVLLILPWTSSLGAFAVSGFWGGVIAFHMSQKESYAPYAVALALTWVGAYLRHPALLATLWLQKSELASSPRGH